MSPPVPLGREVRDWVLVPLTLTIGLMMVMRQYAMTLLAAPASSSTSKADLKEVRERTALARSALTRNAGAWIGTPGLAARKAFLGAPATGVFATKPVTKSAHEAMMTNPDAVTGMLKQSLGGIVPQIAMGTFVSTFFSGFILGRAPLSLPPSFRAMLQRGVDLPGLDVSYFTSLSFYILLLFGLRGVFTLLFADAALDEGALQRQAMSGGFGGGGPASGGGAPPDMGKAFEAEKAALALFAPPCRLEAGGGGGGGGGGRAAAAGPAGANAAAAAVLRARLGR